MSTSSPTLLRLTLGVSPKRAGRPRWLWSSRVLPLGSEGYPTVLCQDAKHLSQVFGSPCEVGVEAWVEKPHAAMMSASMHLALAMHLRAAGQLQAAELVERMFQKSRQPGDR